MTKGKTFFIDLSRCTACRGCQVACKQWHKLPADQTVNRGSHQNPEDLNFHTYKLVRFREDFINGMMKWLFFPDQCRHCIEPPCKMVADGFDEKAIIKDDATGAVIFTAHTKSIEGITDPMELCPYNIPRRNAKTGVWSKCDMCLDRVHNGKLPACVLACPTGTMNFGDRADMMEMAEARLKAVKKTRPKAFLADAKHVRAVVLCEYPSEEYYEHLTASASSRVPRKNRLAGLLRPHVTG
ncbi:4Fe-4S dicluster domain-containing protein [Desulfohalovibrio reitneri]|uniref:4Fe-4S dicluster domain-containing protein n=1 Tax=Desulfohalovibrio reitneri TaxID=1307759 RepID=UPI0004A75CEA|nr:4Fe-4S dicluster domain-containing protein [Desulfohalovibrio reitneri]